MRKVNELKNSLDLREADRIVGFSNFYSKQHNNVQLLIKALIMFKALDVKFAPSYTPLQMLEMGVFEGKYINIIKSLPSSWYKLNTVVGKDDEPNIQLNYYKVKSRQPLSAWKEKGWIKTDKGGWFHWYCLYYNGRRLGKEDDTQIARWRSFVARHSAQVQAKCKKGDKSCNTKQRQALLQWGWNSDTPFTEEQLTKNAAKLKN